MEASGNKRFIRSAWRLVYPYWLSKEKGVAWLLLLVIVGLNLGLVYLTVLLNAWYGKFYDSLQQKNFSDFKSLLIYFCELAFLYIIGAVYRLYLQQMLEIKWRNWLTANYVSDWLAKRRYYILQLKDFGSDNPDQRIAEDLQILARQTLSLSLGLLSSVTTLVSFFMILWNLSGPISFAIAGTAITVPGYMVWAAIIYAAVGSVLTHLVGRPLIALNFNQQRFEANFRFSLIRVRENGEAIALLEGEKSEDRTLGDKFREIVSNWWQIMKYQKRLTWFTAAYSQVAVVFPLVVAAPRYFGGAIELGALMQIASAFGRVQDSLSWFIESYTALTQWKASVDRLLGFEAACAEADHVSDEAARTLVRTEGAEALTGTLSLYLPDGRPLRDNLDISIQKGERIHLHGESGRGKSTLFRALSGLWPFVRGTISLPRRKTAVFLPQKPYLPIGSLREVLSYPDEGEPASDNRLKSLLRSTGLEKFSDDLDTTADWSKRMSLGEQQKAVLIRAILKKPEWLFLDEATASLDERSQASMDELISRELANTTLVSISHQRDERATRDLAF